MKRIHTDPDSCKVSFVCLKISKLYQLTRPSRRSVVLSFLILSITYFPGGVGVVKNPYTKKKTILLSSLNSYKENGPYVFVGPYVLPRVIYICWPMRQKLKYKYSLFWWNLGPWKGPVSKSQPLVVLGESST